jgi:hypothetical protein
MENNASDSRPDPRENYNAAVWDLDPLEQGKLPETLDASPEVGSLWLSAPVRNQAFISDVSHQDLGTYNEATWQYTKKEVCSGLLW